jgi:RNA polymerase sigma-54 factor
MTIELTLGLEAEERLTPQVSPRLVAANSILELSSLELAQTIAREEAENPALECQEVPTCEACGSLLEQGVCLSCLRRHVRDEMHAWLNEPEHAEARGEAEDEVDPLERVSTGETLGERLMTELMAVLPRQDRDLAELLIGSLDERGYLSLSADELAYLAEVPVERVRRALKHLQRIEPGGWGSRNLRECLLIQLDLLAEAGNEPPFVREIVSAYLRELSERKLERIARYLGTSRDEIVQAASFIRHHLHPFPTQGQMAPNQTEQDARSGHIRPDVVIRRQGNAFEIEVIESNRFYLRVNPLYVRLRTQFASGDLSLNQDEREHIAYYIRRARDFITNINARRETLLNVTRIVVDQQREFLLKGVRHLKPMTRAQVAERLGVHESTISRATNRKYVMLPDLRVVPFSYFFTPSLGPKDVIEELISAERAPLTDEQIKAMMEERGISIARRTVTKYRTQMGILPATLRSPGKPGRLASSGKSRRNGRD